MKPRFPSFFVLYWFAVLLIGIFTAGHVRADAGHETGGYHEHLGDIRVCTDQGTCEQDTIAYWDGVSSCPGGHTIDVSTPPTRSGATWFINVRAECNGNNKTILKYEWFDSDVPAECGDPTQNPPSCPEGSCDGLNTGQTETLPFESGTTIPSQGICDTASQCNFVPVSAPFCHSDTVTGTETCSITLEKTADNCTLPTQQDMTQNPDTAQCASVGGDLICLDPQDPNGEHNCGYLNDEYICLGTIPQGNCIFLGSGGMACDSAAGSPPAPDDGITTGTPAPPDSRLSDGTNQTNIYGSGTVSGSSGTPTGAQGNSDGSGNSIEDGDEEGGSGSASGDCNVPPVCSGDAIQCAILEQEWHSACQDIGDEANILTQTGLSGEDVSDLEGDPIDIDTELDDAGFLGTASCVLDITADLGFFGVVTFPLSEWCPLFAFIGLLVQVSAGLISLRIIAGAF